MKQLPSWIKSSDRKILHPYYSSNNAVIDKFHELSGKLKEFDTSSYLIGSAAGTEESSVVGDLDVTLFIKDPVNILKVEELTRPYKFTEHTHLPIRFQFYLTSLVNPYKLNPTINPVYYTAIKTTNWLIGGEDVLLNSNWEAEEIVKEYAKGLIVSSALMTIRIINKQKWTSEQNSKVLSNVADMFLNLLYYKGYFGFSKTEIFSLVSSVYKLESTTIPDLIVKARREGSNVFTEQDAHYVQEESLHFCQNILELIA